MFHDIFIPYRIGTYYLYNKRILSFEITPMMISGLLIEYSANNIKIKNKQTIMLKDFSTQAQASALKKIASNIGTYDEIVTTLSSTAVIYKELKLPFVGHDALQMIVAYEVESLLPFSLEDAVIDFIVTHEDVGKKQSTLLVAAIRKEDLQAHRALFEKAELSLNIATIDIFALYELYKASITPVTTHVKEPTSLNLKSSLIIKLWNSLHTKLLKKQKITESTTITQPSSFQPKQAELLIDIGYDVVRVLYLQDGQLSAVRMIPHGISDIAQAINQTIELPYFDVMQSLLTMQTIQGFKEPLDNQLKNLFEEINRTLLFFEKQEGSSYIKPHKIWFSGFISTIPAFHDQAQTFFGDSIKIVHIETILQHLKIVHQPDQDSISLLNLAVGLFVHFNWNVNFLKNVAQKNDDTLLNKQLLTIVFMTICCIGATFWKSSSILQEKESAYNASKRQFIQAVEQRMRLDLKGEKNIKDIVEKAEKKLKTEKNLWCSFSAQQEHSILEYLQDLSVQIDREALGLQLRQMHLDHEKVTLSGTVKEFQLLNIFVEELMSLQLLQLTEEPRDIPFTITLKPKDDLKGNKLC